MNVAELAEEIAVELELLQRTVGAVLALERDVVHKEPTVRGKTAAAAFLAQFHNGVENILKLSVAIITFPYRQVRRGI